MARKAPRSQRRKKGQSMEGGDEDDSNGDPQQQFLDDDFTIDASNFGSDWGSMISDNTPEDDFYLEGGKDHLDNAAAAAEGRYLKLKEALTICEEFASEKRTAKREASLKRLFKSLSQYATGPAAAELVDKCSEGIRDATFYGIRVGDPPEQYAACRVIEVASVVLGLNQEEWCEKLDRQLRSVVLATQRAVPVRIAALRALSMSVFICSSDSMTTEAIMDFCELLAAKEYRNEKMNPSLRATALDCWALMGSTILDYHLAGQDDTQMGRGLAILQLLRDCLDDASIDLRSAAGECFSLIHESRLKLGVGDDAGENTTERRFRRGSWDGSQWEVIMDEVKQRIAELSVESGHHLSRKAKKEQRSTFREFMATIVEDEAPEEVVSFRGGRLSMHNWKEIIQLNFIRHCLQGGFQMQILTNETLHLIFGANGQLLMENSSLSQLEKRLIMSKTSDSAKAADLDLKANRKKRQNIKNHFLTADGEDI